MSQGAIIENDKIAISHEDYKDDQNGLIHPETEDFNFHYWGVKGEIPAVSQSF